MNIQERIHQAMLRRRKYPRGFWRIIGEGDIPGATQGEDSHPEAAYEGRFGSDESPDDDPHWRDDDGEYDYGPQFGEEEDD